MKMFANTVNVFIYVTIPSIYVGIYPHRFCHTVCCNEQIYLGLNLMQKSSLPCRNVDFVVFLPIRHTVKYYGHLQNG